MRVFLLFDFDSQNAEARRAVTFNKVELGCVFGQRFKSQVAVADFSNGITRKTVETNVGIGYPANFRAINI